MHFHAAPSVAAEVPGFSHFSQEQLDRLAHSVELRRQQLEQDINAYIQRKQDELRQYEIELVEQHRSMERDEGPETAERRSSADSAGRTEDIAAQPSPTQSQSQSQSPQTRAQTQPQPPPGEQKKQKKHGRVHKREKELYGLVTPVFLPLLDARESTSPTKKEKKASKTGTGTNASTTSSAEQSTAARDAEHTKEGRKSQIETTDPGSDMAGETPIKERSASDPGKKSRRSSIKKKSALRHSSTPQNRKRVSLVIDDQVVLPSDMIQEPALTSPTSDTTSATNSTASLDDMIDPRLTTTDAPVYIEHHDALHHSLPLTMYAPKIPPAKPSAPPLSNPPPVVTEPAHSIPSDVPPSLRSPTPTYAPPSYATRSFLDPPPERQHIEDIPPTAGPDPIYPSQPERAAPADENFSTYVGGISGSGVDDVNQVGSVGYPSSLGASYLESYMQTRPLSVRVAAAEREGDGDEVKRLRALEERRKKRETEESQKTNKESILEEEWAHPGKTGADEDADADDFMGSMDDF